MRVHDAMPSRIQDVFDQPIIREVMQLVGENRVMFFVEMELTRLSTLVNVGGNLSDFQIQTAAKKLIHDYPNETLADFKICFERGSEGKYGDFYRLDGAVIGKWMLLYIEEKYMALEDIHTQRRVDETKKSEPIADAGEWLDRWKKSLDETESKMTDVPKLSRKEILEEGGWLPPLPKTYVPPKSNPDMTQRIRRAGSDFYKDHIIHSRDFQYFLVTDTEGVTYQIFAKSKEDADKIYSTAKHGHEGNETPEQSKEQTLVLDQENKAEKN